MIERLAWLMCLGGLGVAAWQGYEMYAQSAVVEDAPQESRGLVSDWDDMQLKPGLSQGLDTSTAAGSIQPRHPGTCGHTGSVYVPRIGKKFPYVNGTSDECLKKGLGLFTSAGMVEPGRTGRCIISGHRDTSFRDARLLKVGDRFLVTSVMNPLKLFVYQYGSTRIVDKDDTTVAVPSDKPELCLTTCYPFVFIGSAPNRYVMCGSLIEIRDMAPKEWKKTVS